MSETGGNKISLAVTALVLVAAFVAAGVGFGFVQTLLVIALAASAVILTTLFVVSLSRHGTVRARSSRA
jgi:hypothetical protein